MSHLGIKRRRLIHYHNICKKKKEKKKRVEYTKGQPEAVNPRMTHNAHGIKRKE